MKQQEQITFISKTKYASKIQHTKTRTSTCVHTKQMHINDTIIGANMLQ